MTCHACRPNQYIARNLCATRASERVSLVRNAIVYSDVRFFKVTTVYMKYRRIVCEAVSTRHQLWQLRIARILKYTAVYHLVKKNYGYSNLN